MNMGRYLQMMRVIICIHTLRYGVHGMTTESPGVVGARLLEGARASEGRVEVYDGQQWGTVCDNLWTIQEANVICKQLGYTGADEVVIAGHFGEGSGDIILDMVQCDTGDEANLFDCAHSNIGNTACTHKEDVGVVCTSTGSLRLEEGTSYLNGRLEFLDGIQGWGTVCNENWDLYDVWVACDQLGLGLPPNNDDPFIVSPGTGPIVLGDLWCWGSEGRLDACPTSWSPENDCTHAQDVGVECLSRFYVSRVPGNPAAFGKPTGNYGRTTGTFCPDNWNINAARVFCKSISYEDVLYAGFREADPESPPNVIINTIDCAGDEEKFADCPEVEWAYAGDCSDTVYPMVQCQLTKKDVDIVPQSEDSLEYGRVEVTVNNMSSLSICMRTWSQDASDVVCRELGFERGAKSFFAIGGGSGDRVFDNIRCTGNEESFDECGSELVDTNDDCQHTHDVGVECLVGSASSLKGFASSLLIIVVIVSVNLVFTDV